jgi:hypothetical protein
MGLQHVGMKLGLANGAFWRESQAGALTHFATDEL